MSIDDARAPGGAQAKTQSLAADETAPEQGREQPSRIMAGKRGLVMGVANDHSIAWGIASSLHRHGAELAFTYQGDAFGKRVKPLADSIGASLVLPCNVDSADDIDAAFEALRGAWSDLDFVVHAVAYSDKEELKGRYLDTTRENFSRTMAISCYSFTAVARHAVPMMRDGGSLLTLSYFGAERVTPNYNVMGVAKAALEASVRYLACGSTRSPPVPCAPWPVRPSATPATFFPTAATTHRCGARSPWRRSARPRSTSCPTSPPASPARFTTWTAATTSSAFRTRAAPTVNSRPARHGSRRTGDRAGR